MHARFWQDKMSDAEREAFRTFLTGERYDPASRT